MEPRNVEMKKKFHMPLIHLSHFHRHQFQMKNMEVFKTCLYWSLIKTILYHVYGAERKQVDYFLYLIMLEPITSGNLNRVTSLKICWEKTVYYCWKCPFDALCSGFTERFYPETNTFHLPFGEMTITLDDISNITGLKINGSVLQAKGPRELSFHEASSLVSKYLNIDEDKVKAEFASNSKQTLSLLWLKNGWMHIDQILYCY